MTLRNTEFRINFSSKADRFYYTAAVNTYPAPVSSHQEPGRFFLALHPIQPSPPGP